MVELDPAYVDLAIMRWQDVIGQAAVLEGDGRTFSEAKLERIGRIGTSS